eukprot:COSAG01_NODE_26449_length_713_cov_24.037459_1_plen_207_part_01
MINPSISTRTRSNTAGGQRRAPAAVPACAPSRPSVPSPPRAAAAAAAAAAAGLPAGPAMPETAAVEAPWGFKPLAGADRWRARRLSHHTAVGRTLGRMCTVTASAPARTTCPRRQRSSAHGEESVRRRPLGRQRRCRDKYMRHTGECQANRALCDTRQATDGVPVFVCVSWHETLAALWAGPTADGLGVGGGSQPTFRSTTFVFFGA